MQTTAQKLRLWYQKPVVWITVGVLACLGFLAMPHAQRVYHRWTGVRKVQRATAALARGDYETAIINAKGALATNAKDLEAMRIMARTAEALGSPQALDLRRQIDAIQPADAENLVGLADAHLRAGNADTAEEVLKLVPAADRTSARYHDAAAGVAWARRDSVTTENHIAEASRLSPGNDSFQIRLAALRLSAKSPEARQEAMNALQRMSTEEPTKLQALRTLLNDARTRGDVDQVLELSSRLAADSQATFSDRLARLSVYKSLRGSESSSLGTGRRVKESEYAALLDQMQTEAAASPEQLYQMIMWMNENHLAFAVLEWIGTLPAGIASKPPAALAAAEAHARTSNWTTLREFVDSESWGRSDFLRLAYLCRALERLGDQGGAAVAWKQSLDLAQPEAAFLEALARAILRWGWEPKAEDVLWRMTAKGHAPRWAIEHLWSSSLRRNDTEALANVSKFILQTDPKNVAARNNFISLALLIGRKEDSPHQLAESLFRENPANPDVAATYGYSLHQQGNSKAAVAAMAGLSKEQLRHPPVALYYSIFLAADGQPDEAEEYFRIGKNTLQFPEQKVLTETLSRAFSARALALKSDESGSSAAWQSALGAALARPDLVEMLARMAVTWQWERAAEEAVAKLAEAGRCPSWATETLWKTTLRSGDNSGLYRVAKLILDANPKDVAARNNFATIALLADNEADSPQKVAETLFDENPGNAQAAATYSLAMFRLGKIEQALAALRTLKPEQLREPRPALYYSLVLSASGEPDKAEASLPTGGLEELLPEEKAISGTLSEVFAWRALDRKGDVQGAGAAWTKALAAAARRPELLEVLGRMALKWEAFEKANEALWKLADESSCPRWVVTHLWTDAEKKRDSARLLKVSRLLCKADPTNLTARNHSIWLSLLTGQDADFPHRQAETLYQDNPGNAEVAVTWSLSLHQRGRTNEAVTVLAALRPEQLREPKPSLYYGMILTAAGKMDKAKPYLDIGSNSPLLPEERALLAKAR